MKLAILASGTGSTAEAIFNLASLLVVSNPEAKVIKKAQEFNQNNPEHDLKVVILNRNEFKSREEFGTALLKVLDENNIEFISQNGWTVYTPENVIEAYRGRIVNAHPGPLDPGYPDFGGKGMNDLAVHETAIQFSKLVKRPFKTEITLHLTTEEFDKGEIVARKEVEIEPQDTPETLQMRLKETEKELLREFWISVEKAGKILPIQRMERVIQENEEEFLKRAKESAIQKYSE